jgi:NAD+ synthase (glutamine-hydrolysing)
MNSQSKNTPIKVAAAQLNQVIGDFDGNTTRIIDAAKAAFAQGARIVLTPELSLTAYPPEDLLLRPKFFEKCAAALQTLKGELSAIDVHVIVGLPVIEDGKRFNAAVWLHKGKVLGQYFKHELPNYSVFDEERYFEPGNDPLVVTVDGMQFGVVICEDFWFDTAPRRAKDAGAQVLLALNASPYHTNKQPLRFDVSHSHVSSLGLPFLTANLIGGQDELVFDGHSYALYADGTLAAQAQGFVTDILYVSAAKTEVSDSPNLAVSADFIKASLQASLASTAAAAALIEPFAMEAQVYKALVLGVKDYLGKNGFPGAVLGLSGGVDSALVMAIAVDALGADKVRAVMMPSPYTAEISWVDARDMAHRLGVRYDEKSIVECFDAFKNTLASEFIGLKEDATEENLQARIRGTLLMALSNKFGAIVLTTGNKSEMAVGYCTLYGDMAGGFAVIKDIPKTLVYRLCQYRNKLGQAQGIGEVIPERIITRAPSAELRADQTDQDSLPEYEVLDAILQGYMVENRSVDELIADGLAEDAVRKVVRLMRLNEYKRRQSPVGIRVSQRAFGRDWRYPITSKYRED